MTTLRPDTYRVAGVFLFVVAAVLLTSVGGLAIAAGPVTLPLLFLAVRGHPTRPFQVAGSVIGGLTAAQLSWGMLYVVGGEMPVVSWLLPIAAGLATGVAFVTVPASRARTLTHNAETPAASAHSRLADVAIATASSRDNEVHLKMELRVAARRPTSGTSRGSSRENQEHGEDHD